MEQVLPTGETVTLIHFVSQEGGNGWRIACMPNMTEFHRTPYHENYQRTDYPGAVTCSACKQSPEFKRLGQAYAQAEARRARGR